MKLSLPFKGAGAWGITQGFHDKHEALDWVASYGHPLCAPEDVKILGIAGDDFTPDSYDNFKKGYGVRMLGLETGFEHLYWHTWPYLPVWGGDVVKRGQIVAFMGNSGNVYTKGSYVPIENRFTKPHDGTHLHWEVFANNKRINPIAHIDFRREPTYTKAGLLGAMGVTLKKISTILTRKLIK